MSARLEGVSPEDMESRLRTLRADLAESEQLAQAARERARDVAVRGREGDGDLDQYLRDRAMAEARVETLGAAIRELEALLPELRNVKHLTAARERMTGISRAHGSLLDQRAKDIQRIVEAESAFVGALRKLDQRHSSLSLLIEEATILADRFGLDAPDLPRPLRPSQEGRVAATVARLREVQPSNQPFPAMLSEHSYRDVQAALRRIADTPGGKLIEEAGAGIMGDDQGWESRRKQSMRARRDAGDAARLARLRRYDEWLREALEDGPVPVEVLERKAEAEGMAWREGRSGLHEESVSAAFSRVGAWCVVPGDNKGLLCWTTSRHEGYAAPEGSVFTSRQVGALRG